MSIEAMRQALEFLDGLGRNHWGNRRAVMDALRAAIEQAEKPMAWFHADNYKTRFTTDPSEEMVGKHWKPLYTVPRQEQPLKIDPADCHIRVGEVSEPIVVTRQWVGLTDEEYQIIHSKNYNYEELALAVEAKLKEKNHDQ